MDPQYVQQLAAALEGTLAPNTETIKQATKVLNEQFYKSPKCIPALFHILQNSSGNAQLQQLAAVELRKRVGSGKAKLWAKQTGPTRTQIKAGLLQGLAAGAATAPLVRHATSRLVAAIAKIEIPEKQWPELLGWLWTAAGDSDAAVREIGLYTLYCILDTIVVGDFTSQLPQLLELFQRTLNDPENLGIRIITLRALGKIAEYIEGDEKEQVAAVQALVPNMVSVLGQALEAGDADGVKHGFDVLETLLYVEVPYLTPHLAELVKFQLMAAGNQAYGEEARVMALNSLVWLIKFKKSRVQSLGLSHTIIEGLLPIGAEPEDDDDDDDSDSPSKVAFKCLDALATNLPPSHVFPPLFTMFQQYCASNDPNMRKSAIMAFGVTVEGVSFYIQPHLEQLWPFLERALQDPEMVVRNAACKCLMCLTDMLGEDCAKKHETLLPLLSGLINDQGTQRYAMVALDAFLECLGETIVQYLPTLMERLIAMLENAPTKLKSIAVGAIGSSAHAAKEQFVPYFEPTMQRIAPFLELVPEDGETGEQGTKTDLRGVTQDTVGTLAEAVGKEVFRPYYQSTMELAFKATALNNPRLKECSFIYFAVMTKVYGEEFAPLLPTVMPLLVASLSQSEIAEDGDENTLSLTENGFSANPDGGDNDEDDDFVDMEDLDENDMDFAKGSAIAIEKEVATDALLEIFRSTKTHFLPYVEPVVKELVLLLEHFWDGIRKSAATTLLSFIATFHDMSNLPKWVPGIHPTPLPANLEQLCEAILPKVIEMWEEEDDRDVVNSLCEDFQVLIEKVGPAVIIPKYLDTLCTFVLQILEGKAPCQLDTDEDDEDNAPAEQPAEQSEYDALLVCSACDLVAGLSKALGEEFGQAFGTFFGPISGYFNPSRTSTERSTAVGSLAEVTEAMGPAITSYTPQLLELGLRGLADGDAEVQSNAAFLVGTLVSSSSTDLSGQYGQMLSALQPLFSIKDDKKETIRARDNACGAIARLIIKNQAAIPVEQVLPPLIAALPLQQDFEPYTNLFEVFFRLASENNPTLVAHLDQITAVFAHVLAAQKSAKNEAAEPLAKETHARLLELVRALPADKVQNAGLNQYL